MDTRLAGPVVLAPTDLSAASVRAATYAADLARRLGGTLVLLRVLLPREVEEGLTQGRVVEQQMDEGCVYLRWWFTTFVPAETRRAVPVRELVTVGHPEDEIPAMAALLEATMVIMATRARTGFRRAVLGSIAEAAVRRAPCPVVMLRSGAETWTTARPDAAPARGPLAATNAS